MMMQAKRCVAVREATNSIIKTGMGAHPKRPGYKSIDLSFEQDTWRLVTSVESTTRNCIACVLTASGISFPSYRCLF